MRKLTLLSAILLVLLASCTPETINRNEQQTDKNENCPPNDKNCNGVPDNQE